MKAIVNSESLLLLSKLVKEGSYQVTVKTEEVKLIAESIDKEYQIEIIEPNYGSVGDGTLTIPKQVFSLLPKKTNLAIDNNIIKSVLQEIKFENEELNPIEEMQIKDGRCVTITNFKELIECRYALAKDGARPVLECIYIDKNNFVSLDGYRMSVRSHSENITDEPILIPSNIAKLLNNFSKNDIATIYQDDEHLKICFGWISIMSKKPKSKDGGELKFIDYEKLFPKDHTTKAIVEASKLVDICKQIVKLNRYSQTTYLSFKNDLSYVWTKECGIKYKRYFKAEIEGDELYIAVNARYILETLKNYKGNVTLYMGSTVSPIIVTDGESKKDLVLPIRIMKDESEASK